MILSSALRRLLIERLPAVWRGEAAEASQPQDESLITHAPKARRSLHCRMPHLSCAA